jgi:hypothetical protein
VDEIRLSDVESPRWATSLHLVRNCAIAEDPCPVAVPGGAPVDPGVVVDWFDAPPVAVLVLALVVPVVLLPVPAPAVFPPVVGEVALVCVEPDEVCELP